MALDFAAGCVGGMRRWIYKYQIYILDTALLMNLEIENMHK